MANILFRNADKTVNTIAERNAISPKLDDMEVIVLDAIADIEAGPGPAVYKWSASLTIWIMIANSKDEPLTSLSFANNTLTYVDENGSSTNIDLSIYEPADPTILKDADIGVSVQAYSADTVIDANYVHTDNNYTSTEKNKLAGIESGATADQTKADIDALDISAATLKVVDTRLASVTPEDLAIRSVSSYFTNLDKPSGINSWYSTLSVKGWTDAYQVWELIGGSDSGVTDNELYFRVGQGTSWASTERIFMGDYHPFADKLTTARNISLTGDVTGSASFDGSSDISINAVVQDDSHNHESLKNLFTTRTSFQSNHYGASVVLLAPAYDGVNKDSDKLDGNITLYRGSSTALNTCVSIDVSYQSAYNSDALTYNYNISEVRETEFVYCTYNGVKYLALNIKANSQNNRVYWNGIRSGDLSEFFTVVNYIGDDTQAGASTIVNQEVNDSIVPALPTSSIFESGDGTWSLDYDGYKGAMSNVEITDPTLVNPSVTGSIGFSSGRKFNRNFSLLESETTQYIILCKNEANNDVNGHIAWQRTSGNYQGQQLDVIVSSSSAAVVGGSIKAFTFKQSDEEFKLVTLTSVNDSQSYVAIKYVGNGFPLNLFGYFDGYMNTTAGVNEFAVLTPSDVTNEADLPTNNKFEVDGNSIFHEGFLPDYTQITGLQSQLDNKLDGITGAKGDIYVHNGTSFVKLSAGVDGQILFTDSSTATGLKWDYPTIG